MKFRVTFDDGTEYQFAVDDEGYETPESICSLFREALAFTERGYDVQRVEAVEPEPSWWQRFWAGNVSKDWS